MLTGWNIHSVDQVGFELLVVSLLELLKKEGVFLEFAQLEALKTLRNAKLAKIPAETLYRMPSTLHHSFEAFHGHINFNRMKKWLEPNGSMIGSPASAAAYLIGVSVWDERAEDYLRQVVDRPGYASDDFGGMPYAWPTTIFEVSWALYTLSSVGISIGEEEKATLGSLLEETLTAQKGLVGFVPGGLPDADDTAKALKALYHLGSKLSVNALIRTYETSTHFKTYPGERNPNFSANCNILILLLTREDRDRHIQQIVKATQFLTDRAFREHINKKWTQLPNGSWEDICEVTSYRILALSSLLKLPWTHQLGSAYPTIIDLLNEAKSWLISNQANWKKGSYLWIEKVTYSSPVLSEAYCLAAALAPLPVPTPAPDTSSQFCISEKILHGMQATGKLISLTSLFKNSNPWALPLAEMQACFALQALKRKPQSVFPRARKEKDKYMFLIPLAVTAYAGLHRPSVSLSVIYKMMVLSILNFHADEYMESVVEAGFEGRLDNIRDLVREVFAELNIDSKQNSEGGGVNGLGANGRKREGPLDSEDIETRENIKSILTNFIHHILRHPAVIASPSHLQTKLAFELQTFLLAHITQAQDNHRIRAHSKLSTNGHATANHPPTPFPAPPRSFYNWVRTTSADHTSCPFSFIFFNCLISSPLFSSPRTAYLSEDLCRNLATMCRMYNDIGSQTRDAEEKSLNSIDFAEFQMGNAKEELMWLAEFERRKLNSVIGELEREVKGDDGKVMQAVRMVVDLTDLYGLVYVLKDVGIRTRGGGGLAG
ncbi:hypothetical protein B0T21DRAFT_426825 [Apiosordaria backusii]|uniref:Ent-kaurene synthase n=1 Tax=Apiosordaria backusii TaxID=314023 RepID=A0AA40AEM1_9PEZI|nr:hypothetical protein B0T21DRAFT_426825 [Apiosordaria backusii]